LATSPGFTCFGSFAGVVAAKFAVVGLSESLRVALSSPPTISVSVCCAHALEELDGRYVGVTDYLQGPAGMRRDNIDKVRHRLLERA
jgi:hypothetical protein